MSDRVLGFEAPGGSIGNRIETTVRAAPEVAVPVAARSSAGVGRWTARSGTPSKQPLAASSLVLA